MRLRSRMTALLAGIGLVACAGLVLAQAPDWGGGAGGGGGGFGGRQRQGQRWRPGLALLVAGEGVEVQVANTDNGVDLTLSAEGAEAVEELQNRVQGGVMRLAQTAERAREQMGPQERPAGRRRDIFRLLIDGDLEIGAKKTENGMVVSLTSDNPEVVQALQEDMPQRVAAARAAGQQLGDAQARWQRTRQAFAVLANDEVKLEVKETEDGISVLITSENPQVVKQIQATLADYFRGQKESAQAALQWGGGGPAQWRGVRPGAPGGAAPRPAQAPRGAR
nr:flagellar hook-length control protein FliK [Candidatus Brocadiia bacterium]